MPTKREIRNALTHFLIHAKKGDIEWCIGDLGFRPARITDEENEAFRTAITDAIKAGEIRKGWRTYAWSGGASITWKHNGGEAFITFRQKGLFVSFREWDAPQDIALLVSVNKAMTKEEDGDPLPPARA